MKNKAGISLITLIITIVVIIILTGAIVLSISKNNPIDQAREAVYKSDIANLKDNLQIVLGKKVAEAQGGTIAVPITINDLTSDAKLLSDYTVIGNQLVYKGADAQKLTWAGNTGVISIGNYSQTKGVNKPLVPAGTGINGITWSGSTESNVADVSAETWYSYTASIANNTGKEWANMKTADGSYWVWIPRYAYKITSGYRGAGITNSSTDYFGTIDVKFLIGTSDTATDGTKCVRTNTAGTDYVVHPAFTFGGVELEGIWVAKCEARSSTASPATNDITPEVRTIVGGSSWRKLKYLKYF